MSCWDLYRIKSLCTPSWHTQLAHPAGTPGWHTQLAHPTEAYPRFQNMKRLGVSPLPPGWDASPSISLGFPDNGLVPIHIPGGREALRE